MPPFCPRRARGGPGVPIGTGYRGGSRERTAGASVVAEEVARVDLVLDVAQLVDEPVGHDDVAPALQLGEVADDLGAVEAVLVELGLVDDDLDALGLDPLHDALHAARA